MSVLLKTLRCEDSKLYGVWDGHRHLLTDADPVIEVREERREMPGALGSHSTHFRRTYAVLVLYGRIDAVQDLNEESINRVRHCTLSASVVHEDDSMAEHFNAICLEPLDIDLGRRWEFAITDQGLINKLLLM